MFTVIHRWAGLITAAFLFFSGVTGAVISWDDEIDAWLNAKLFAAVSDRPQLPATELARLIEQRDPKAQVFYVPMAAERGKSMEFYVQPRIDPATGKRFDLNYNEIFLDPGTGDELGRRRVGRAWPITRENVVSFVHKLHYTMHIPEFWGSDRWGVRLLGIIAIIWTIDCFVGFYLTLPSRRNKNAVRSPAIDRAIQRSFWQRWKPAWAIKTSGSSYRVTFDIHRAFGLWTWGLLLLVAFTAFSLNLNSEVFSPIMRTVSNYTPSPFETRTPTSPDNVIEPKMSFDDIIRSAEAESRTRGWNEPVGSVFYARRFGIYIVSYFKAGDDNDAGGVGPKELYFDGGDGRVLGERLPWVGTAADLFAQAQFPVHSGRILGLTGRILISVMGLVVAALSVTGVIIWWRKRRARVRSRAKMLPGSVALPGAAE